MKLRSIKINRKFVPDWLGNKNQPLEEQIIIYFSRIPGTSEKNNFTEYSISQKGQVSISYNNQLLASSLIEKVENFEIEEGGDVIKIKTGADLARAVHPDLPALFDEIRDYLVPPREEMTPGE